MELNFKVKAYLRLRPTLKEHEAEPYLQVMDDIEVSMTPPKVRILRKESKLFEFNFLSRIPMHIEQDIECQRNIGLPRYFKIRWINKYSLTKQHWIW